MKAKTIIIEGDEMLNRIVVSSGNSGKVQVPVSWVGCNVVVVKVPKPAEVKRNTEAGGYNLDTRKWTDCGTCQQFEKDPDRLQGVGTCKSRGILTQDSSLCEEYIRIEVKE